ncbi:hypothetical protein CAL7716_102370 (plasmid) [Calothrix sp. PCC 7716]|nr:hypothetical protein CAL7716_102370 [Calothrix sp. PCC 7716]
MSATKHFINTNCFIDETTGTYRFKDGFPQSAPEHIMQQRLANAGLIDKTQQQKQFNYECSDLDKHKFYQAINNGKKVKIDSTWYNVYLDMEPYEYNCNVQWFENNATFTKVLIDFIVKINNEMIAFWYDMDEKQFYCRKLINYKLSVQ